VRPADDLAVATYYLRLAYACWWCWSEQRQPLLGAGKAEEPSVEELRQAIVERSVGYTRAFQLVEDWAREVEPIHAVRRALKPFLDPPLSAEDYERVTRFLDRTGNGKRRVVWRVLRERYRQKLLERVGAIMPERAILDMAGLLARLAGEQAALVEWTREELRRVLHDVSAVEPDDPTDQRT
jgi:AcrR family transcriptional regulator